MEAIFTFLYNIINTINYYMWNYIIISLLLIVGLYFTIKLKFIQLRFLKHSFLLLFKNQKKSINHISSLEALSTSLASVVGVGSIAGMSIAISLGGPGTIFWVWVISFLGMSSNIIEHVLGQVYKKKTNLGLFMGGPSYYIKKGLKSPLLAISFSIILILSYGFAFNSVQANTIGSSINNSFNVSKESIAIFLTILTALIIFGGIQRISKFSSYLVPIMGFVYILLACGAIILNIEKLPYLFVLIIKSAFGFNEVIYGSATYMFLQTAIIGAKRALFATEAGMGSTPNISASAMVDHPTTQGFIGMLGVFFVAFIICTSTALIILSSDVYLKNTGIQGVELVQNSLLSYLGEYSVYLLSFCIITFGFTSIIGNYSYAENNMNFLISKKLYIYILRILVIITVYYGTITPLENVWNIADFFMGLMVLINLYALLRLREVGILTIKDYENQIRNKKDPIFSKSSIPQINDKDNVW